MHRENPRRHMENMQTPHRIEIRTFSLEGDRSISQLWPLNFDQRLLTVRRREMTQTARLVSGPGHPGTGLKPRLRVLSWEGVTHQPRCDRKPKRRHSSTQEGTYWFLFVCSAVRKAPEAHPSSFSCHFYVNTSASASMFILKPTQMYIVFSLGVTPF